MSSFESSSSTTTESWTPQASYGSYDQAQLDNPGNSSETDFSNSVSDKSDIRRRKEDIARDLHDYLGPSLSAMRMLLDQMIKSPELKSVDLDALCYQLQVSQKEFRRILDSLRSEHSSYCTVSGTIKKMCETHLDGIKVELDIASDDSLRDEVAHEFSLIAQETLLNIYKYANASEVSIVWHCEEGQATLQITDNGKGFDTNLSPANSYGIIGMIERAEKIGAALTLTSEIEQGTKLQCILK